MPSFVCPNDGSTMESDQVFLPRRAGRGRAQAQAHTHTCPDCGYSEVR